MAGFPPLPNRRWLLTAAPTAFLMTSGAFSALSAAVVPPENRLPFRVLRDGDRLGTHVVSFSQEGDQLTVDIAIDLEVRFAFLTAFRYRHRNREVWQGGRLIALDTETDDDGTAYRVSARGGADGLEVDGSAGRFTAPADVIPTSYWKRDIVEQVRVLDTQRGGLVDIAVQPGGLEQVQVRGRTIGARRYTFTGGLQLSAWYSEAGQWVKLAFMARGSTIDYVLDSNVSDAASRG